jgi:ABC-2 type transport system permease protein
MNTPLNAMPGSQIQSQITAPASVSEARLFYWSVRRELWENRSIYFASLAAAALIVFGFLISTIHLREKMRGALTLDPMKQSELIGEPYNFAALLIMFTVFLVGGFYCLEALHSERRDRSILFWKSLPVSDLTTVLSKASIPIVVLPLLGFVITLATQLIILFISSLVLLGSGVSIPMLWEKSAVFPMALMLLYHLVTVHTLWYAPFYGWLLLVSAWARRAVILWAVLPPVAICIVEKFAFNTSHFLSMLQNRLEGGAESVSAPGTFPMDPMTQLTPGHFLSSPGLWIGLVVAAVFLAGAVRIRRLQGPI